MNRTLIILLLVTAAAAHGQGQRGSQPQGAPPPGAGRGAAQPAPGPALAPAIPNLKPVRSCDSLATVALPDTTIESAAVDPNNPGICRVMAVTTHPPAGDRIRIWIGIPASNWNGRFLGTGGGGFSGGSAGGVNQPVASGYASGATDTGHESGNGSFGLDQNNRLNWMLIRDNAYLGIHEMTQTGKALTQAMYGVAPRYSYFNGCSTGGRQGLMEAQRYPADYDGILSGAPAINWSKFLPAEIWGEVVMQNAKTFVPQCKFAAASAAAVEACDASDGVRDGVLNNPRTCRYDPQSLVGSAIPNCGEFTTADAGVIRKIWQGPRRGDGSFLWYGIERGADLAGLASSGGTPPTGRPFSIAVDWFKYFLAQDPKWDWATLTQSAFEQYFDQSVEEFSSIIGTDNPDLAGFRDRNGKIIVWHGWSDQLIFPEGTIDYYERVQKQMGGQEAVAKFARLFMAPGVGHCAGGPGPQPSAAFDAVVSWVEQGKAPDMLNTSRRDQTGATVRGRPLCPYPLVAKYKGTGSADDAANYSCSTQ